MPIETDFMQARCLASRLTAALIAATLVAGCAQTPVRTSTAVSSPAQAQVPLPLADNDVTAQVMAAEFALRQGDRATAASDYAKAAAISDDPTVAQRAALLALGQDNTAGAKRALARMQALHAPAIDIAAVQARLALAHGHRDAARVALQKVLATGDRDAWSAFAQVLADARDAAAAGLLLETLATPKSLPAGDARTWVALSQLGEKLGRHAYARKVANAAAARFARPKASAWAAHLALAVGDNAGAKALFEHAVKASPDDADLRLAYAAALSKLGDVRHAQHTLAGGPQTLDVYRARAAFAARADDHGALAKVFTQLQAEKPALRERSVFLRAQLADTLDKRKLAMDLYGKVDAGSPHAFDAALRRAVLLDDSGQTKRAHALARRLQTDNAEDDDLLRRALQLDATLYRRHGDHADAVATFNRGLKQLPEDVELLYGRSLSEADAGDTDQAIADLQKVLKLDPDNMQAANALGYTLADQNRNLDQAKALLTRALAARPDEPAVIDSWGWLQYRLGHLQQAEKALRRAWDKLKDPDIGTHLGEVLWAQGRHDDAEQIFAAVRKLAPDSDILQATLERLHQ